MTDTDYLDEYTPRLLIPSFVIFGKKADLSSEYEDLCSEEIHGPLNSLWILPHRLRN